MKRQSFFILIFLLLFAATSFAQVPAYDNYPPTADKILQPDGSIVSIISGTTIAAANAARAQQYKRAPVLVAKYLLPDGSIVNGVPINTAILGTAEDGNCIKIYVGGDNDGRLYYGSCGTGGGIDDLDDLPGDTVDDNKIDAGLLDEADPIVGAITGIVKANGAGVISAAEAGTDYQAPISTVQNETKMTGNAVGFADNPVLPGTGSVKLPGGTTVQRPAEPTTGEVRNNVTTGAIEWWDGDSWNSIADSEDLSGKADVNASTTGTAGGLVFGADAQYDIPIRGAAGYGRLATSAGMQAFFGLGITVSGSDVTFPGKITTTAADGSRASVLTPNTAGNDYTPSAGEYGFFINSDGWHFSVNGVSKVPAMTDSNISGTAGGLVFGSDAEDDIAVRGSSAYGRVAITEQTVAGRATGGHVAPLAIDSDIAAVSANHDTIPSAKAVKNRLQYKSWTFDPKAVCDGAVDRLFLMSAHGGQGIIIMKWALSFEADPTTEADLDLKRADAWIGVGNAATMDVLDTTAGVASETTAANINGGAAVAEGKVIYLEFGTAYTEANHQVIFEMWFYEVGN